MKPHAEIDQVWPRDERIRLVGHLHGGAEGPADGPADGTADGDSGPGDDGTGWELLLVLRDHEDHQLRYRAPLAEGQTFDASLPVDDLSLDGLHEATWDVYLSSGRGAREIRLRAGRHLDDIGNKKKIMIFPAQAVTSDEDATRVRPFYTVNNNLSVECLPGERELLPGEYERPEWID